MPKAYYQCPKCFTGFCTKYKHTGPGCKAPEVKCGCSEPKIVMTYRGDGYEGRGNWPHKGKPPVEPPMPWEEQ